MGILQVHDFIADVVGGLYQIHEWMTGIAQRFSVCREAQKPHLFRQSLVDVLLRLEEAELSLLSCCRRGVRILHDTGNGGVGHHETAGAAPLELVGKQSEGVGITFKVGDVVPECRTDKCLQLTAVPFGKEGLDGFLAAMSERRIAQVVCQTGGGDNLSYLFKQRVFQFRALLDDALSDIIA